MKKLSILTVLLFLLTGCSTQETQLQRGMHLRDRLTRERCSFTAVIIADYGEYAYSFTLGCSTDDKGDVSFIVIEPESISGIAGKLTGDTGFLTFADTALAFPMLAEGEVSPVSAPWLMISALRGGYIVAAGPEGDLYRLTLKDSYAETALQVDVWLDGNDLPQKAEIFWQGRRVLSLHIEEFAFV